MAFRGFLRTFCISCFCPIFKGDDIGWIARYREEERGGRLLVGQGYRVRKAEMNVCLEMQPYMRGFDSLTCGANGGCLAMHTIPLA